MSDELPDIKGSTLSFVCKVSLSRTEVHKVYDVIGASGVWYDLTEDGL